MSPEHELLEAKATNSALRDALEAIRYIIHGNGSLSAEKDLKTIAMKADVVLANPNPGQALLDELSILREFKAKSHDCDAMNKLYDEMAQQ